MGAKCVMSSVAIAVAVHTGGHTQASGGEMAEPIPDVDASRPRTAGDRTKGDRMASPSAGPAFTVLYPATPPASLYRVR